MKRRGGDFPRPPAIEPEPDVVRVVFNGREIVRSSRAVRVLETSHPPVYFVPPGDVLREAFVETDKASLCEWKGRAAYFDVVVGDSRAESAAFSYPEPVERFADIAGWLSVYAGPMDACHVGDELALPQPGGFYSGWVTSKYAGPFKGGPGSMGW